MPRSVSSTSWPSAEKPTRRTAIPMLSVLSMRATWRPVAVSQKRVVPSPPSVTTSRPSGDSATARTSSPCPGDSSSAVATDRNCTRGPSPSASIVPSGEKPEARKPSMSERDAAAPAPVSNAPSSPPPHPRFRQGCPDRRWRRGRRLARRRRSVPSAHLEPGRLLAGRCVPCPHRVVPAHGDEGLAVAAERNAEQEVERIAAPVAGEPMARLCGRDIPQGNRLVDLRDGQCFAVRREGGRDDHHAAVADLADLLAAFDCEEKDLAIRQEAGRGQHLAIRREGQRLDISPGLDPANLVAAVGVVDVDDAVGFGAQLRPRRRRKRIVCRRARRGSDRPGPGAAAALRRGRSGVGGPCRRPRGAPCRHGRRSPGAGRRRRRPRHVPSGSRPRSARSDTSDGPIG